MIRKFQNPSGKLTYEEALKQAGERVENQMKPSIQVKGVNNSNRRIPNVREKAKSRARIRNREKEEQIQKYNQQNEMHALIPSGKHYDPVADEDVVDYSSVNGPKVIGMSGTDPLMEFYVGGEALGPLFKLLGKGALYTLGRYYRGTNYGDWAAAKLIAPEMNRALVNNSQKLIPSIAQHISLTQQPIKQNESGLTSLKFFERPSKISEVERLGIPKGDRNNIRSINPDNVYGNLRFIRNIDGLPTVEDGLVQLGNSDKLLTNFTTDLPFRLHDWYPNIPGPTYMIVSPRAFKGKKFYSIKPSDSFLSTVDSKVTPNQIRIISGDPKILKEAERRGMRTLTSDKLQDLFNVGSEITKKEFELGRNGAVRPFANADVAIDDFKFRNRFYKEDIPEILSKYPEGVVTPYRAEVDKLITQNIGRPSIKDYQVLENMTGLDTGITSKFDSELIKKAKDPLANKDMFEKVYYPVTSQIEEELMNSIGLYPGPHYSFFNLLKLNKLKGNPLKKKQGGKMIYKFKKGNKIHIKKANRGKFTDYCGGKVTNECIQRGKNSSDPAVRKRATFAANARKWNHKKGGVIVAGDGIKLGNIFSKAQGFLNSDLGKNVVSGITSLYSGIKQSNNQRKQEEQLLKDYNYISKQINTQDVINKTNQQFQELQQQDPNIHVSEIDWRNLYGKNEGIAKQQAQANARNYLVNARQQMMLQNSQSSGGGLDFSGLINAGAQLLAGNKNKTNTGTTNTTTTNTQIPSTATPTYFSSSFDWSKPTLTSAIKFST